MATSLAFAGNNPAMDLVQRHIELQMKAALKEYNKKKELLICHVLRHLSTDQLDFYTSNPEKVKTAFYHGFKSLDPLAEAVPEAQIASLELTRKRIPQYSSFLMILNWCITPEHLSSDDLDGILNDNKKIAMGVARGFTLDL